MNDEDCMEGDGGESYYCDNFKDGGVLSVLDVRQTMAIRRPQSLHGVRSDHPRSCQSSHANRHAHRTGSCQHRSLEQLHHSNHSICLPRPAEHRPAGPDQPSSGGEDGSGKGERRCDPAVASQLVRMDGCS